MSTFNERVYGIKNDKPVDKRHISALQTIVATQEGVIFLRYLLEQTSALGDVSESRFLNGKQSFGLQIINLVREHAPQKLSELLEVKHD